MRVMISTIHKVDAVKSAIKKISPEKIIFLVDYKAKNLEDKNAKDKIKNFIKTLEELGIMEVKVYEVNSYDLTGIAQIVVNSIDVEHSKDNKIVLHITEGRKTLSYSVMYAAFTRKPKIEGIYYITEEEDNLLSLPILELKLINTKKIILKELKTGKEIVKDIAEKAGKTEAMIYAHINDLKKDGFLTKDNKLTAMGEIAIL